MLGHEFMGEVVEVGAGGEEPEGRRSRGRAVPDRLRRLRDVQARALLALRELEPQRLDGREALGPLAGRAVRLLAPARRLRRRPGRVRARAVRRRRADQGAGRAARRAGAVPVGHLPDRLHGRRDVQHPAGRRRRGLGRRARSVSSRSPARGCSAPSASSRSIASPIGWRWRSEKAGATEIINYEEDDVYEALLDADRRARPRRLHRRRRHRGARPRADLRVRSGQAGADAGDRSPDRAAPGDPLLPQRRHGLGDRRLRRLHRQVPDGRGHEPRRSRSGPASATCSATCARCSQRIQAGEIDPSFVITHHLPLAEAPRGYEMFLAKKDNCEKVVLHA